MYQNYKKSCFLQKKPACVFQGSIVLQGLIAGGYLGSVLCVDLNLQSCTWTVENTYRAIRFFQMWAYQYEYLGAICKYMTLFLF